MQKSCKERQAHHASGQVIDMERSTWNDAVSLLRDSSRSAVFNVLSMMVLDSAC